LPFTCLLEIPCWLLDIHPSPFAVRRRRSPLPLT
jgi:hypothetical protein